MLGIYAICNIRNNLRSQCNFVDNKFNWSIVTINFILSIKSLHSSKVLEKYKKISSDNGNLGIEQNENVFEEERDSKILKINLNSLRADLLVKSSLQIARNKVERIFYENRVRINGQKVVKKSCQINIGDEVDVIKSFSQLNPSHLIVSRIILLNTENADEGFKAHVRRYNSLLIENYLGINAYKSSNS